MEDNKLAMRVEKSKIMFGRFVIVDEQGSVIDDANGYGYKSYRKGVKAMWYKFGGGKQKIDTAKQKRIAFMKQYPGLDEYITNLYEWNFKEMARGECTEDDFLDSIKEKFGINMPKEYLHD